jgi:acetylornithine deacetylase/succinyl-diaminopimelate desuccinylase-like protein
MDQKLFTMTCPGATDARFLRERGIPALGFMPMNNTPVLLHDNDEFVNEKVYLRGILVYEAILQNLSMLD